MATNACFLRLAQYMIGQSETLSAVYNSVCDPQATVEQVDWTRWLPVPNNLFLIPDLSRQGPTVNASVGCEQQFQV